MPVLSAPRDGTPDVVTTQAALDAAVEHLAAAEGPVAVDAERASGYRYGQAAYLVQLRRADGPIVLVDPVARLDLTGLARVLDGPEWVLHAASQDLPCLADLGLRPRTVFDTELGARVAGLPRVGLAAVTEHFLGIGLAKEHSAVDWSTRPMPASWLTYAALDVELLLDVRDALAAELERQGKLAWAREEFAAVVAAGPPPPKVDPWRKTSGVHKLRSRRAQAVVRSLWTAREELARSRDVSPGPDPARLRRHRRGHRPAPDDGRAGRACPSSPARPTGAWASTGSTRSRPPWPCRRPSCPARRPAATARRRRAPGPTGTRSPPCAWAGCATPWPRSRSSTACRWRTCSPPTPPDAWPGSRPAPTSRPSRRSCAGGAPGTGRSV